MNVLDRIRRDLRRIGLIGSDVPIAAAVSGGSDSVALAHALHRIASAGDVRFAGIVHFNHLLRPTSNDDEALSGRLAAALAVPFVSGREDVQGRARRERRSIEDAARRARYEFFERARAELCAGPGVVVALGHTRDDQAETFLLRLVRGAGPRGLSGMYPRHGAIVRPLLSCRREELRAWLSGLAERGVAATAFVDDETTQDVAIPRNRVRAELLPMLAARFNPAIVDVLADEADLARDTWAVLDRAADSLGSEFDIAQLLTADPAIARVALWRAMRVAAGGREIGYRHVAAAMDLVRETGDRAIDVPGLRVERIGARLVLVSRPRGAGRGGPAADPVSDFRHSLSIPGEVHVDGTCTVTAEPAVASAFDTGMTAGRGAAAAVRADLCSSLAVRNRRPGDRFRPLGLNGSKKLQDFFVDRKIARNERSRVPLVVDAADRIVWVAGHGIDEAFAITDAAQAVLLLRLTRP
ncbi:MAG TPA: tRNA lysidine(34) synthetase TilS [Vicinamibacterales bacterium]|nr:tRNA lysidine(34) synthetase TilS [Vicinamibacterales bacterium]